MQTCKDRGSQNAEQRRLTTRTNRLSSTLKEYFPQALDWFEDRDTVLCCDFLQRWPSLKHAKRARQATLRTFFSAHNLRRAPLIEERIHSIRWPSPTIQPCWDPVSRWCRRSLYGCA
jgi:hypothetical protein